ncbi:hypothetical protein ABK249_00575 [Neorhizobium sp. Rsf11]|uniref:Protoheme IX farnesyltransferase n=1 Tax=Neorhizobium phenanthreniclasticum TaxID=3157917 RepID=A0ABV0LUY2_9HYPH
MIETIKLNDAQKKSRRNRNIALGLVLVGLVILFYVMTLVKIGNIGG